MYREVYKPSEIPPAADIIDLADFSLGLNLRDAVSVLEPGYAVDLLNVRFSERRALRPRSGFWFQFNAGLAGIPVRLIELRQAGNDRLALLGGNSTVGMVDAVSGAAVGTDSAVLASYSWTYARVGTPTTDKLYVSMGADGAPKRHDGSSWATASALGEPQMIGISPDGRLMCIGFAEPGGGASTLPTVTSGPALPAADGSMIVFSDPFNAEAFDGDNFIRLRPGDGEAYTGVATFGGESFIFKESAFWVLGNPGAGSTGKPIFPRRQVQLPDPPLAPAAVSVGDDGVYFVTRRGLYFTDGGIPVLLSELIDPVFTQRPMSYYTQGALDLESPEAISVHVHDELVIVNGRNVSNEPRQWVLDRRFGAWTVWDLPATCFTTSRGQLTFADSDGCVWYLDEDVVSDFTGHVEIVGITPTLQQPPALIPWHWQSGFTDYGTGRRKILQALRVLGSGDVDIDLFADFVSVSPGPQAEMVLGDLSGPVPLSEEVARFNFPATSFAIRLSGQVGTTTYTEDEGSFTWNNSLEFSAGVHRIAQHVRMPSGALDTRWSENL